VKTLSFDDKPSDFPTQQVNGDPLKPITHVLLQRRATSSFTTDPVPDQYLQAILRFGTQAPSGYNLQPWRFVVVRDPENRKELQKAAMDQTKVGEAPIVIVAFAVREAWREDMDAIFDEGARRGSGKSAQVEAQKEAAIDFLDGFPPAVWLNRHTMIAVTTMMLVAEAYGLDTAPMEGFDPDAVRRLLDLPREAEVVALLAIGFAKDPDKPYPGRLAQKELVFQERFEQ
jgi:nitroreductase